MNFTDLPDMPYSQFYRLNDDHTTERCRFGEYIQWMTENHGTRIAFDEIDGGMRVSTIFLGMDHGHGFTERPQLFETMVFTHVGGSLLARHYSSYAAAMEGHREMVERLGAGQEVRNVLIQIADADE